MASTTIKVPLAAQLATYGRTQWEAWKRDEMTLGTPFEETEAFYGRWRQRCDPSAPVWWNLSSGDRDSLRNSYLSQLPK